MKSEAGPPRGAKRRDGRRRQAPPGGSAAGLMSTALTYDARPGRLQDAELFAPPTRILKTYTEALVGLGHGHQPGSFNTLLSQGCVLENSS